MSGSLNKVCLIGNLGADPETKSFQNGGKVCNFRLACTESWKDKSGEKQERTEWVSVAVFNDGLAGVAERFLRKGSKCYVEGKLQTRKWQDQSGNDRYSTEVVLQGFDAKLILLGDKAGGSQPRQESGWGAQGPGSGGAPLNTGSLSGDLDDDIPFITSQGPW